MAIRLNKLLASQLQIGRRQADSLIATKQVLVDGKPVSLGAQIELGSKSIITVNGNRIQINEAPDFLYILINKPVGYVCSRRQQGSAQTIYALLPKQYAHLKPVGRLDKDSSGILLLTNDGNTAHRMMHPSFGKLKRYEVQLDKPLTPLHHQMINDYGITLQDGTSKLQLEQMDRGSHNTSWLVSMREGRNRQIRRTFAALGYTVTQLHRIQFGSLLISDLHGKLYKEVPAPQI